MRRYIESKNTHWQVQLIKTVDRSRESLDINPQIIYLADQHIDGQGDIKKVLPVCKSVCIGGVTEVCDVMQGGGVSAGGEGERAGGVGGVRR